MPNKARKMESVRACHNCGVINPNPDGGGHCRHCGAVVNPAKAAT
jgi:hypothetical protein